MHENQGNSVIFFSHYTEGGLGKTGLTVTVDVYEVIRDGTATLIVNDGACTEIGAGLYRYLLAAASVDAAAEYVGVFHTATDTVDCQDIPAIWVIDRAGLEKLDSGGVPVASIATDALTAAAVKADAVTKIQNGLATPTNITAGTITTVTNLTNLPTMPADWITASGLKSDAAAEIASAIWGDALTNYTGVDEAGGEILTAIGNVAAIKAKTDNLPTDPADQSILAGAIAALPLASDYTAVRAAKLDYLDAAISSRATSGEGTISWTYTLTASDNVTPIQYATVWVTSDAGGTAIEASGQTDAAGQITFLLNAGTYYVWRKKRGYRFSNPDVEVVA